MEKQKKTMIESPLKAVIYTFLMYFLAIFEVGILSGFRFVVVNPAGRNGAHIGLAGSTKGYAMEAILNEIGMQFIVMSILLFLVILGYCFWMGFKRQIFAVITVAAVNLLPMIGLTNATLDTVNGNGLFSFFWGYGTSGMMPMMSLFGLHMPADPSNYTGVIIFYVIFTLLAFAAWFGGKAYRKVYADKYEFDLTVPLS